MLDHSQVPDDGLDSANQEASRVEVRPGYRADWALFVDWCTATGHAFLPAAAETIEGFVTACPARPASLARRVTAITAAHRAAGHPAPPRTPLVRDAVRGRPARTVRRPITPEQIDAALHQLPSHGWTGGFFGRRDRALLALAETGWTYQRLAALATADITLDPATGTVRIAPAAGSDGDTTVLAPDAAPVLCRPCAMVRWLRVLEWADRPGGERRLAHALKAAPELTDSSPHACRRTRPLVHRSDLPLLPPISQWGSLAVTPLSLTTRSVAHLAVTAATGRPTVHRTLGSLEAAVDPSPAVPPHHPDAAVLPRYTVADRDAALARRRADQQRLEDLDAVLDRIAERADQLAARTRDLLEDASASHRGRRPVR